MLRLLLAILLSSPVLADDELKPAPEVAKLKYRNIGPAAGGRVSRVAGVPGDPLIYYFAGAASGVWKSVDGGLSFSPVFDDQPTSSIGSIAVSPSDPNVVWVGSGEANIRGNVAAGNGIYRSTDAGKTWKHVWKQTGQIGQMIVHPQNPDIAFAAVLGRAFGPNPERGIYRTRDGGKSWEQVLKKDADTGASDICFDPTNPRILFAGMWQTRRKPWEMTSGGKGSSLHVSHDGGDTWDELGPKPKDDKEDIGLPEGIWGKVAVAVSPADPKRVWALIEAEKGGLYRSDDGGEKWAIVSDAAVLRQRLWYFGTLTPDPVRADVLWAPQVPLLKSIDGGKTFAAIRGTHHGDHHDLWIDPKNPKRMIEANDGGVDISSDGGKTWHSPALPIAQFYHIACDNQMPYRVMGNMQDQGTASGPSNSLMGKIPLGLWHRVGGGETGYSIPDPTDSNIVWSGEYGGAVTRYDHRTRQARNVTIYPFDPSGFGANALKYRFQWTAPLMVSKHDKSVYHAANVLFRTRDDGQTWDKISPDLSRNDRNKQQWSGGPITGDNTGVEVYGTIFAIAESPIDAGTIWAGTDDGLVHLTRDGGKTWKNVSASIPDMPDWATVRCIEPSEFDAAAAYLVADAHRLDDNRPLIWKTTDFGQTWRKLSDDLPGDVYLHVVREDPTRRGLLYLGTERGVMVSHDDGKHWKPLRLNMPTVAVHDLAVKNHDLAVATMGRSIWILDNLTVIRQWKEEIRDKPLHAFGTIPTFRWRYTGPVASYQMVGAGENVPVGVTVDYWLKSKPKKPMIVEIHNAKGDLIRRIDTGKKPDKNDDEIDVEEGKEDDENILPQNKVGHNRWVWDLRREAAATIKRAKVDAGNPAEGPVVAPGQYKITLVVDGQTQSVSAEVILDPRVTQPRIAVAIGYEGVEVLEVRPRERILVPDESKPKADPDAEDGVDVEKLDRPAPRAADIPPKKLYREAKLSLQIEALAQEAFALRLRDDVSELTAIVEGIRSLKKQIAARDELIAEEKGVKPLLEAGKRLVKKLDALEEKMHNPRARVSYDILAQKGGAKLYSQLVWLLEVSQEVDGPPTQGVLDIIPDLEKELARYSAEYVDLRTNELVGLNELAARAGLPTLWLPKAKRASEPQIK